MAVKEHGVHFDVSAQDNASRALQAVENSLGRVSAASLAMGRSLLPVLSASAAISFGSQMVRAAMEAEQASNRLVAVLRATGHAAGITKRQIDDMADAMAQSTQFDDESIRQGAATLLKFGNIYGAVFTGALKVSADLAAFMGTEFPEAAQMIGRSLQSPTEGLTMMERQFGKLTDAQEAHINSLVRQGRAMDAQNAVLDLWRSKVGGTAAEMNTGITKSVRDFTKAYDELNEAMGKAGGPRTTAGLDLITRSLNQMKDIIEKGDWTDKLLAIAALQSPYAQLRGLQPKLENKPRPGDDVLAAAAARRGWMPGFGPNRDLEDLPLEPVLGGKADKGNKGSKPRDRSAEFLREAEWRAEKAVELEEMGLQDQREAQDAYTKYFAGVTEDRQHLVELQADGTLKVTERTVENVARQLELQQEGLRSLFVTIDMEQDQLIEAGAKFLDAEKDRKEALKDSGKAARELGMHFVSAAEDAIVKWEGARNLLQGIEQDLIRFGTRKLFTEPAYDFLEGVIKDIDLGGIFGDIIPRAAGGPVSAGQTYLVGENGPELLHMGGGSGHITPNGGGRPLVVNVNVSGVRDVRGFRSAAPQIGADLAAALARASARNS